MALTDTIKRVIGYPTNEYEEEFDDGYYEEEDMMEEEPVLSRRSKRFSSRRTSGLFDRDESPVMEERRTVGNSPVQMVLVKAKRFAEVERIAENLKQRRSVIVNFSEMDSAQAQRTIDFLSGTTFALSGSIQRVSKSTFIFAVGQVDLVGRIEEMKDKESYFTIR